MDYAAVKVELEKEIERTKVQSWYECEVNSYDGKKISLIVDLLMIANIEGYETICQGNQRPAYKITLGYSDKSYGYCFIHADIEEGKANFIAIKEAWKRWKARND